MERAPRALLLIALQLNWGVRLNTYTSTRKGQMSAHDAEVATIMRDLKRIVGQIASGGTAIEEIQMMLRNDSAARRHMARLDSLGVSASDIESRLFGGENAAP
jgi:hypothetical protein